MYFQNEYLRDSVVMTLNDTYRIDLPKFGLLGSLFLFITGDTIAAMGRLGVNWRICDFISKIEIIGDGSIVIKSFTAKQAKAMAFFDQKISMPDSYKNGGAVTQFDYTVINFGRFLSDVDYGLDLSRYKNVEIKITNTAAATNYTSLSVSIMTHILRDAVSGQFKGCMHTENWRTYIPVVSGVEYLELPSNWLIRRIILQSMPGINPATGHRYTACSNLMSIIELTFATGNERVWKDSFTMLEHINLIDYGAYVFGGGSILVNAACGVDVGMDKHIYKAAIAEQYDGAVRTAPTTKGTTYNTLLDFVDSDAQKPIALLEIGVAPHNCAAFRFDNDLNPATWLDTKAKDVVKLDITTSAAATVTLAKNNIVLDRLVR